jgi:hypothetical protein
MDWYRIVDQSLNAYAGEMSLKSLALGANHDKKMINMSAFFFRLGKQPNSRVSYLAPKFFRYLFAARCKFR